MTQEFWIPGPLPGLNDLIADAKGYGGRGYGYSKTKREWSNAVMMLAKSSKLRPITSARISFEWHEKDKRRDPDNFSSAGKKLILDGLVKAGVLDSDGWRGVDSFTDVWVVDAKSPGVLVRISDAALMPSND